MDMVTFVTFLGGMVDDFKCEKREGRWKDKLLRDEMTLEEKR